MVQQINNQKKEQLYVIDWLVEHFPKAFFKKSHQIKILQVGIFDEILTFYERLETPPFSKKALREGLSYYSASPAYLSRQKSQTPRIDLFGNEVDIVTEEQALYAQQRYQQRYRKNKADKADKENS